ncbi:hypothetical protein [Pseudonocardia sp. Ae505_Ps2]|uniref:hypothetical protein n=1 Tax=Pseudonocardia sp. Ae505_Ps2 TaxID=1885034 RepID=UPI00094F08C4|nr:hypothetical protein [Pseudonocardia sp. Ae505_Ps2]OLM08454.1 hypothetical protein Ae505Ps2_6160 [Pseudonocardia sp. Ae505_Ps2]
MVVVPQPISDQQQDEAPAERHGLYVVDTPANTASPRADEAPDAGPAERPGPGLEPLAPWDQRIAQAVSDLVEARPRWNQAPPSYAQTWAYSRTGDWTTSSNPLVRGVHAALTLAALAVVFPLDWLGNVIRDKPSGFMITVVVIGLLVLSVSGGG